MARKPAPADTDDDDEADDRQRLDKWLWHARVVRTRTAAQELVTAGRVRFNGTRCTTPARPVKRGDVLTIALDGRVRVLEVTGFAPRRGDAEAAAQLYAVREQTERPRGA